MEVCLKPSSHLNKSDCKLYENMTREKAAEHLFLVLLIFAFTL